MPISSLKNKLVSQLNSVGRPMDESVPMLVHTLVSNLITEYITSEVKLIGSYSGIIPPSTPESVPVDSWSIVGVMPPIPIPNDLDSWISSIENGIKTSFYTGTGVSHPLTPVPAFPTISINVSQSILKGIHEGSYDNPQDAVFTELCKWIGTSLMTGFVKSVPAGLVGTGVMTITSVKL